MLKNKELEFETLGDLSSAKSCLVFIHGWKGNKNSFKPFAKSFNVKDSIWYLPQAPYMVDDNPENFSWTYEISKGKYEREEPIKLLLDFFKNKILSQFNSKDVFLLGFSQGALVCFEMIKIFDKPLGGIFPIGGFMGGNKKDIRRIHPSQLDTPIIIGHGKQDEVISIEESKLAYELLSKESQNILFEPYQGGHKIGYGYIKKIREIIEKKYK